MIRIDFDQLGGLPLKQPTLEYMQDCYTETQQAFLDWAMRPAQLWQYPGGEGTILSGIEESTQAGQQVYTPGWIVRNNELLRFGGATVAAVETAGGIGIQTVLVPETFKDGSTKPVFTQKIAVAGGDSPLAVASYYRAINLRDLRPVLARTLRNTIPAVAPGTLFTVNFNIPEAKLGDVAVASVSDVVDGLSTTHGFSPWVTAQARVPANGQVQVVLLNQHQTQPAFDGLVEFKLRILK